MKRLGARGTSILAALVFVGILGVVAWGVSALSPTAAPGSQNAAAASGVLALGNGTVSSAPAADTPSSGDSNDAFSTKSPKDCNTAISRALNKLSDGPVTSTDQSQAGTLDACYGAVSKTGQPSAKTTDYQCVGRSGTVTLGQGSVTSNTSPDKSTAPGDCSVKLCTGAESCSQPSLYKGGIQASGSAFGSGLPGETPSDAGITDGSGQTPTVGSPTGSGQIGDAFNPSDYAGEDPASIDKGISNANQIAQNDAEIKDINQQLEQCAGAGVDGCDPASLQAEKAQLQAQTDSLKKQISTLQPSAGSSEPDTSDIPYSTQPSSAPGQTVDCYDGGNTCYPANDTDAKALTSQGYSCQAQTAGADAVCTKGTTPPPNQSQTTLGQQRPQQVPQQQPRTGGIGGLGGAGGSSGLLNSLLQGALRGLSQGLAASNAPACSSDPNAYAQQQQQYNMAVQQYQLQMQQYQLQQQIAQINGSAYLTPPIMPQPPQQCQQTATSNTCPATPVQPDPAGCQAGTWRPVTTSMSNGAQCTSSWQCVPGGATPPTAQISCQPQIADVGMSVAISFSCGGATGSAGAGFDTQNALSGSTSTVITAPPSTATGQVFGVKCTNSQSLSAQAQCTVQVGKASIILVANPQQVNSGEASTIGWITSGMQSCVVSSPDLPDFTAQNAGNTSVNGMATTSPLTSPAHILLHCTTTAGGTRDATTTVGVSGVSDNVGTITAYSSIDGRNVARGASTTIGWAATGTPAGTKIQLWLYDIAQGKTTGLIKSDLDASSTYAWTIPSDPNACDTSDAVCASDFTPGQNYGIEIDAYTGDDTNPTYGAYGYTPNPFTITQ